MRHVDWNTRLRYLINVFFLFYIDHECLQNISKRCESKPRTQRWMEFLSAYNFRFLYRRGRNNANTNFLSRLPLPPTEKGVSGSSTLSNADELGVYLIRACGYTTPSCPISGGGLGGLAPSSYPDLGELVFLPVTPVLGGLLLTNDDFRKHRAPMPYDRSYHPPLRGSYRSTLYFNANSARVDTPCPPCTQPTQSLIAILTGNVPSRPAYSTAANSGFAASAAVAPPPKAQLRPSSPLHLARLGSTISLRRFASPHLSTVLFNSQLSLSLPLAPSTLHASTPDPDVHAAAVFLSNTLLSYSHRDRKQV